MFRGTRRAYATDPAAVLTAEQAIERRFDAKVEPELRRFFYTPFMHAEDLAAQERSVALNAAIGTDDVDDGRTITATLSPGLGAFRTATPCSGVRARQTSWLISRRTRRSRDDFAPSLMLRCGSSSSVRHHRRDAGHEQQRHDDVKDPHLAGIA